MTFFSERRHYQRCSGNVCKALMSTDRKRWDNVELFDVSAGGLRIATRKLCEIGSKIYLNISIYNALSEFNMSLEGSIVRKELNGDTFVYGVKFANISKYLQVQLDEIIKAKTSVMKNSQPVYDDGIYSFLFNPRHRPNKLKMRL